MEESRLLARVGVAGRPVLDAGQEARRPERPTGSANRVLRRAMAILGVTTLVGCVGTERYLGTGTLHWNAQEAVGVASQSVSITNCSTSRNDNFSVLQIGDDCNIYSSYFHYIVGGSCKLAFGQNRETLRVTDVVTRVCVDCSPAITIRLGADDTGSGRHALYEFQGNPLQATNEPQFCASHRAIYEALTGPSPAPPDHPSIP